MTYDGGGGGLALDLNNGTKFLIDTWFDPVGLNKNTVLSIAMDDGAQTATVAKIWTVYQVINFQVTEDFLFSSFLAQKPSIDLSSIDSITLYMETDQAGDYALLTGFSTDAIPEPASMALFALGGLAMMRRKRL